MINDKNDSLLNNVKVDKWDELREDGKLLDTYEGQVALDRVDTQKYMGIFIQNNGLNNTTIDSKIEKANINAKIILNKH